MNCKGPHNIHISLSLGCCSVAKLYPALCNPMDCCLPGFPVLHYFLEFAWTYVHWVIMPSNHLILCRSLLFLLSIFPSIRVFSNESALHIRWSKYWSFSFSISPYSEYLGLISFSMDWFDILAVQGTLKSLFHHHNLKAILWRSAFFMVQLSHRYICTFWESLGNHIASLPLYLQITRFCYILFIASTNQKEGKWTTFWKGEWQGHIVQEACRTGYLGTSIFGK